MKFRLISGHFAQLVAFGFTFCHISSENDLYKYVHCNSLEDEKRNFIIAKSLKFINEILTSLFLVMFTRFSKFICKRFPCFSLVISHFRCKHWTVEKKKSVFHRGQIDLRLNFVDIVYIHNGNFLEHMKLLNVNFNYDGVSQRKRRAFNNSYWCSLFCKVFSLQVHSIGKNKVT